MRRIKKALFLFRRDLRLVDNTALNAALQHASQVIPAFIFDPRQIQPHPYQSKPALSFMLEALSDLEQQLARQGAVLAVFSGQPEAIVQQLAAAGEIDAVFVNRDYTPFSMCRDTAIASVCAAAQIDFQSYHDLLLIEPEQALKTDGKPYTVFTPFYHNARRYPVEASNPQADGRFGTTLLASPLSVLTAQLQLAQYPASCLTGGRTQALTILTRLDRYQDYETWRDFPARAATTQLSPHNKFGTCSVREIYHAIRQQLGGSHALLRELYWRDFFTHIALHFPQVFGHAFHSQYDRLAWGNNRAYFDAWRSGMTGFPLVDAGMRQLNATGFMHNRLRMVAASFLVKDLDISWRWGERYFAQTLVDYDPCVNNGNWQWAASTGCDAQPYFRIFNPWLQQQKFDADCAFIHHWIPELRALASKTINDPEGDRGSGYPKPIVNHRAASVAAIAKYKAIPGAKRYSR